MPSTLVAPDPATELLLGKGRRALLALLLLRPDERFYLRELARLTGVSAGAAQRELRVLERVGLVRSERRGNQVYYEANKASPLIGPLRTLLEQTVDPAGLIRAALAPLADRLAFAVIHGPAAAGTAGPEGGIDVLVVGSVQASELSDALTPAAERLGRPVHPSVYTPAEFQARVTSKPSVVTALLGGPLIPLIGAPPER